VGALLAMFALFSFVVGGDAFMIYAILSGSLHSIMVTMHVAGLFMWTVVGIVVFASVVNVIRPSRPTRLSFLGEGKLKFEQGTYQKRYINSDGQEQASVVTKGKRHGVFERSRISNVILDRIGEQQRLSFDYKTQRINIGKGLTEPEREWLFEELKKYTGEQS
jgi:hypothetical protein